jgi:hypothetical protein
MAEQQAIRHWVAIAGRVTDSQTQQPIVGAELTLVDGPPAFQSIVEVCRSDPQWEQRQARLNHTVSRSGGMFFFTDLPAGGPYQLEVVVPRQAARYGRQQHNQQINVAPKPESAVHPVRYQWADVVLVATGVTGVVLTDVAGEQKPVAKATVELQDAQMVTDKDGTFGLHGLIGPRAGAHTNPPTPRLRVTAPGFAPYEEEVPLQTGVVRGGLVIILQKA